MSEVLRALEGPLQPMICVTDDPAHIACDRSARCTVNVLWVKVRDAISGTLDAMTLADLVPQRHIDLDPQPTLTGVFVTDANDRELVIRDRRVAPAASPDHEILQGINLTIRKGETHAIMGPNGSARPRSPTR